MNRDFWRGGITVAVLLGTLSLYDAVGSEPLPDWTSAPKDLDLPASKRVAAARRESGPRHQISNRLEEVMRSVLMDQECQGDCDDNLDFEAGYAWAAEREVDNADECRRRSVRFVEGCKAYVEQKTEEMNMSGENEH